LSSTRRDRNHRFDSHPASVWRGCPCC